MHGHKLFTDVAFNGERHTGNFVLREEEHTTDYRAMDGYTYGKLMGKIFQKDGWTRETDGSTALISWCRLGSGQ